MSRDEQQYVLDEVRQNPDTATRDELQVYLEWRGFAVYPNEPTYQLRKAVIMDLEVLNKELECM